MNKTVIILIALAFSLTSCSAQLKTGIVELISWRVDETEYPLDNVKYTSISARDGGYEIKICFQKAKDMADYTEEELNELDGFDLIELLNDKAEYFTFKIKNKQTNGNITKAKVTHISIENTHIEYIDEKASGTIEINHDNNLVKIVFQHSVHNNDATQYEIIWKQ